MSINNKPREAKHVYRQCKKLLRRKLGLCCYFIKQFDKRLERKPCMKLYFSTPRSVRRNGDDGGF